MSGGHQQQRSDAAESIKSRGTSLPPPPPPPPPSSSASSSSSSAATTTTANISASGRAAASDQSAKVKPVQCIQFCEDALKSHETLCDITERSLGKLLAADEYLRDIVGDISHEEVLAQIAVVKGQSITVYVRRGDFAKFKIVIPEASSTVLDLKVAIRRHYELNQRRLVNKRRRRLAAGKSRSHHDAIDDDGIVCQPISWRYIWRTYVLDLDNVRLSDDVQLLSHYGVRNKSSLKFVKKAKYHRKRGGPKRQ